MSVVVFEELTVRNFLAVAEEVVWPLKDQGLVVIVGENGAGKSTLFEGLVWVLWGRTVRGYRADKVVNRRVGKDCEGRLVFNLDGVGYRVTRYRKHHTGKNGLEFVRFESLATTDLTQQTTDDTQAKINEVLGIDFETFIRGPMMPQGSYKRFSQMTDAEMKEILESALQVDVLARAAKLVKERLDAANRKYEQLEAEGLHLGEQLVTLRDREEQLLKQHRNFLLTREARYHQLGFEYTNLRHRYEGLLQLVKEPSVLQGEYQQAQQAHERLLSMRTQLSGQWQTKEGEARRELATRQANVSTVRRDVRTLQERSERIEQLEGNCPTCEQKITKKHQHTVLEQVDAEIAKLEAEGVEHVRALAEAERQLQETVKARSAAQARADNLVHQSWEKVSKIKQELASNQKAQDEATFCGQQMEAAKKRAAEARQEASPYEPMMKQAQDDQAEVKTQLAQLKPQMAVVEHEIAYLKFWQYGFGNLGLKSHIFRTVTPYMNQRAEHYAHRMTSGEISLEFTTQLLQKNGQIKDQFGVLVDNRTGAGDYEGNSGGEKSRADLAINFVISDLVCYRASKAFPQRFFDEPFEHLDDAGIEAVMELLQDMTRSAGSIFVVTHQPQLQGQFNRVIKMVKQNARSSMVEV